MISNVSQEMEENDQQGSYKSDVFSGLSFAIMKNIRDFFFTYKKLYTTYVAKSCLFENKSTSREKPTQGKVVKYSDYTTYNEPPPAPSHLVL